MKSQAAASAQGGLTAPFARPRLVKIINGFLLAAGAVEEEGVAEGDLVVGEDDDDVRAGGGEGGEEEQEEEGAHGERMNIRGRTSNIE